MKKVIVRIGGGLGNQLNNYAIALQLARASGKDLCKDPSEYLMIWNRKYQLEAFVGPSRVRNCGLGLTVVFLIARIMQRLHFRYTRNFLGIFGLRWCNSDGIGRDAPFAAEICSEEVRTELRSVYLAGCCHDMRTFAPRDVLLRDLKPVVSPDFVCGEDSVSLHIRRGDYLSLNWALNDGYYRRAISEMKKLVSHPQWVLFSDDIEWCKEHYGDLEGAVFVRGDTTNSWIDLVKMSRCRHHIIANSTFSWWGAYLSEGDGYTICPDPWLPGVPSTAGIMVPRGWRTVPNSF